MPEFLFFIETPIHDTAMVTDLTMTAPTRQMAMQQAQAHIDAAGRGGRLLTQREAAPYRKNFERGSGTSHR